MTRPTKIVSTPEYIELSQADIVSEVMGDTPPRDGCRLIVTADNPDSINICMQHLNLSDPPYSQAEAPGRMFTMSRGDFAVFMAELQNFWNLCSRA